MSETAAEIDYAKSTGAYPSPPTPKTVVVQDQEIDYAASTMDYPVRDAGGINVVEQILDAAGRPVDYATSTMAYPVTGSALTVKDSRFVTQAELDEVTAAAERRAAEQAQAEADATITASQAQDEEQAARDAAALEELQAAIDAAAEARAQELLAEHLEHQASQSKEESVADTSSKTITTGDPKADTSAKVIEPPEQSPPVKARRASTKRDEAPASE